MKIPLTEHLQTLGNREELVGLKVWDKYSTEPKYIQFFEDKDLLFCTPTPKNGFGYLLNISRLSIDLSEQEK